MFQVPEWGNDVPDTKVKFGKTSQKKKNKISTTQVTQESPIKLVPFTDKKQPAKTSTNKRKLKKNRQKNRQLYQKLSSSYNNEPDALNESDPGRFVLNPNKVGPIGNGSEKETKSNKPKFQKTKKQKSVNTPNGIDNISVNKKPVKRKNYTHDESDNNELQNIDTDKIDEIIINAKKKKLHDAFKDEDREDLLFGEKADDEVTDVKKRINNTLKNENTMSISFEKKPIEKPKMRVDHKKELIRKVLQGEYGHRNSVNVSGNSQSLRERMLAKLQAAQFRYINEKLYTSSGAEAKQLFQADPAAFDTYHQGYQQQIKKWPINPLDVIVKRIMKMPRTHSIADMGCGAATLARRVPHAVRSFDLVGAAAGVEPCDMARTPLLSASMDVVVYCLALMGTELALYLAEGNRVLKTGGHLLIAEVESRFDKLEDFTHNVERLGFKLVKTDQSHEVFYFLEFKKTQEAPKKARHLALTLKPCLYKRR